MDKVTGGSGNILPSDNRDPITAKQRYQIKHRELFLSRQVESIPATQIRGKCSVTLLNETESLQSYLSKEVSLDSNTIFILLNNLKKYFSCWK